MGNDLCSSSLLSQDGTKTAASAESVELTTVGWPDSNGLDAKIEQYEYIWHYLNYHYLSKSLLGFFKTTRDLSHSRHHKNYS